jgi:hypothetical protein
MEPQTLKIVTFIFVFVLVGIVVLILNKNTLAQAHTEEEKITRIDNKINWLFYLFVASISILTFLFIQLP